LTSRVRGTDYNARVDSWRAAENRREERWKEDAGARMSVDGRTARLQDASGTGARFECNFQFEPGASVVVTMPWGKVARGTVIGSEGGVTRVQFASEIERPY
jgi:hypothetical protein